jgi:hypothetical protein
MQERDLRPVVFQIGRRLAQTSLRDRLRRGVLIDPNQMTLSAEALCDFVRVPAQAQGRVDIGAAAPDG